MPAEPRTYYQWLSRRANKPLGSPVLRTTGSPAEPISQVRISKPLEAGAEEVTTRDENCQGRELLYLETEWVGNGTNSIRNLLPWSVGQ